MGKVFLGLAAVAALMLSGCDEDHRKVDEKIVAPNPDFSTRYVMACPKCGAPTSPYRISALKSYYRCTSQPPKYPYHEERDWQNTIRHGDKDETQR